MLKFKNEQFHYYHMVTPSPWPFYCAISVFHVVLGMVCMFHDYETFGRICFGSGIISTLLILGFWWTDVINESLLGMHTPVVQRGLYMGFKLFIISEIMFFAGFFWAYFYFALHPDYVSGGVWPPIDIKLFDPYGVPLTNTYILIFSSVIATLAHAGTVRYSKLKNPATDLPSLAGLIVCYNETFEYIKELKVKNVKPTLWEIAKKLALRLEYYYLHIVMIFLLFLAAEYGFFFVHGQAIEYVSAPFDPYSTTYGSCFFLLTGFHGLHVIVGATFITVCAFRWAFGKIHINVPHHVGYTCAAWYWHFVDVVWLFLYYFLYLTPYLIVAERGY